MTRIQPHVAHKRRVLLVDDHPLLRQGLAILINNEPDLTVVGEAATPPEALKAVRELQPELIVLDLTLEGGDGLELCKQLHQAYPKIVILVLSMHDEQLYAERAMRAGAAGYVMKQEPQATVLGAMRQVLAGQTAVSEQVSNRILRSLSTGATDPTTSPLDRLTNRELEVFRMIGSGQSVTTMADTLFLSHKTIEAHKERIKQKLNLKTSNELLQYAIAARHDAGAAR